MKNLWMLIAMACFLVFAAGSISVVTAQYDYEYETVAPDSVSIDDMDPVLYDDEAYPEQGQSNNTGLVIGIIAVAIVGGLIVYKAVSKKKE